MNWSFLSKCVLKDSNMAELSNSQCAKFCSFMMLFNTSRKKTFVARGESDENLMNHYNFDTSDPQMLAQILFNIGAKGRLSLSYKNGIDPDDTSTTNFAEICKLMNLALRKADNGNSRRASRMRNFISNNRSFVNDFLTERTKLMSKYNNLSMADKQAVNIYYLYILHTINSYKYSKISNFVSTSEDLDIANKFARNLLILGWVPMYPTFSFVSKPKNDYYGYLCKSKHLPFLNKLIYPEQAEVSIRCGILPHFIIGFRIGNNFYVNPAIFETMDMFSNCQSDNQIKQLVDDIIKHGLRVDQSNFIEYCKLTNYIKYFT